MDRASVYALKMDTTRISTILTARRESMVDQLTSVFQDQVACEQLVRGSLAGVTGLTAPTVFTVPGYHAAAKEMMRSKNHWAGGSVHDAKMAEIIARWALRGLSSVVLTQIAYEVFQWTPPAP